VAKRKEAAEKQTNWRKVRQAVIQRDGKQRRNCKHDKDLDLHHVVFRSLGGSDDDENVTSLCTWCHLFGVHGGRIRASGRAPKIVWELGCLRVEGRERSAA
jgi:5-methylcytosine-specific restriction endonuclease McrA